MRTGVTIEDITGAADRMLAAGERPTVEGVRNLLGTGSPATVNALLKQYYKTLPERLTLPAPIASAAAQMYKTILMTAKEDLDRREAEQQAALRHEREQVQADKVAFEAERTSLSTQLSAATTELSSLQERHQRLERQLIEFQQEAAAQARNASAAEARATSSNEERERMARKYQEEINQLRERHDANERHWFAQIEDLKTVNKRLATEKEKEQAGAARRLADAEAKILEQGGEIADLRKDGIRLNADLAREQRGRAAADSALQAQTASAARELETAKSQRDAALSERDISRSMAEQLRNERDAALRDLARDQGRLETLQGQIDRLDPRRPLPKEAKGSKPIK